MKQALIDVGSNSIRLTVYDLHGTSFAILFKEKIMAGLAGYVENGELSNDGILAAADAINRFQNTLKLLNIENLKVFATASLRNVSNTSDALRAIRTRTGIQVEVLSGEMEAKYGYDGAMCEISEKEGIYVDIGGASTEIVLFCDGHLQKAGSVPLGSLKLYRECVRNIIPGKGSQKRIRRKIRTAFTDDAIVNLPAESTMVCTGGTARAMLNLCQKLYDLPESQRSVSSSQLAGLVSFLKQADHETAVFLLRYEPARIHTLIPGIMILHYLSMKYQVNEITVSHYGVREGYLLNRIHV